MYPIDADHDGAVVYKYSCNLFTVGRPK